MRGEPVNIPTSEMYRPSGITGDRVVPRSRWVPHPTYRAPDEPGLDPRGDRCVCGGIRYWHAVAPHGCDDCPCTEFEETE